MQALPKHKKGGVVSSTVMGIGGLIIGLIVTLVIISTLNSASLLGSSTIESNTTDNMTAEFYNGIDNVSEKLPTILLIVAVVFLFGALVLLVRNSKLMGIGGGGSI